MLQLFNQRLCLFMSDIWNKIHFLLKISFRVSLTNACLHSALRINFCSRIVLYLSFDTELLNKYTLTIGTEAIIVVLRALICITIANID